MTKTLGIFAISLFLFAGCELLEDKVPAGLTDAEIIKGLKTALDVGADSATTNLHKENGYLMDEAVKILLPDEAKIITSNLSKVSSYIPGGEAFINNQLEKLVESLNKAAEDAAKDALPILSNAITGLSIYAGLEILNGTVPTMNKSTSNSEFDSLAATHYLEQETKADLIIAFSTPINTSLDKKLIGITSTNDIWKSITDTYNSAVSVYNLVPLVNDLEPVNSNLGEHATEKALDGLFLKVGEEEKKIRKDPFKWALEILQKVFGSLL